MKRIALFSRSGSEIDSLYWQPDVILTNNIKTIEWINYLNPEDVKVLKVGEINDFLRSLPPSLITLHGYLRILPPDICERHEIYNGHPGLISRYSELKGKDPQEKVIKVLDQKFVYPYIGSVVHRCTPELDGGEIITECVVKNTCNSRESVYNTLKITSLKAWETFFQLRGN